MVSVDLGTIVLALISSLVARNGKHYIPAAIVSGFMFHGLVQCCSQELLDSGWLLMQRLNYYRWVLYGSYNQSMLAVLFPPGTGTIEQAIRDETPLGVEVSE